MEIISPSVMPTEAPPSEMSKSPIIEAIDLKKRFGQTIVLRRLSLTLCKGEVIVIVGRSGSGKSTLLRCINQIVPPDEGQVRFNGQPFGAFRDDHGALIRQPMSEICRARARMPMVFQRFNLFQHQSALQNVIEAQVTVLRRSKADAEARAVAALERVGLRDKLASHPAYLSGGEQQRVGIARALAMTPDVILFDEPTSALDPELVVEVLQTIRKLARDGMSMIVVTHEMGFARQIADCIYFLDEGIVLEKGPPEQIFESPENPKTRAFVKGFST